MVSDKDLDINKSAIEFALRIAPLNYTNTAFKIEELVKNATIIRDFLNKEQKEKEGN